MLSSAPTGPVPPAQAVNSALLHRALGLAMIAVVVALVLVRRYLEISVVEPPLPAYVLAGVSFLMCAASLIVLKPLVPRRNAGQTVEAYWRTPSVAAKAMRVWFILEGGGVLAAISYFLGGGLIAAALIVLAVALYWMNGPRVFTGD